MPGTITESQLKKQIADLKAECTNLRTENQRLREKAKQADSASRAKSDFLAMISHEIRTPMNGVIGISELLLNTELQPRQKHFAQLIRTSARSLLTLIHNLLDFSKIEAQKMGLEIISFDLGELLQQLLTFYGVAGRQKGVTVRLVSGSSVGRYYKGDALKLHQILVNLLGNAIKFTDNGQVTLEVECLEQREKGDLLRFIVTDTGEGISATAQKNLFEPFVQADCSSTRRFGGSGLGLSICSKLAHLMGGEIEVESKPGKGSRFLFTLLFQPTDYGESLADFPALFDMALPSPEYIPPASELRLDTGESRVLIVDDDQTNRIVMEEIFKDTGLRTYFAANGQQAIELCHQIPFDLIFMDCQMPVMDGFEATSRISDELRRKGSSVPPIIALTADATEHTHERCFEVGMKDYLVKPLDFKRLQTVLSTWLPEVRDKIQIGVTDNPEEQTVSHTNAIIDLDALKKLEQHVGNLEKVVKVFVGVLEERTTALKAAFQKGCGGDVQKYAHMLKGSSSQVGAVRLAKLCQRIERAGKNNNLKEVEPLLPKVEQTVQELLIFFRELLD
ncbi:MAG: hypothetical protein CSA33_06025 [Desulfobulbus propionicus]|nr:MAG: hypothetical protein CSA33_06025 [Desulfobulbus propionicus]